ncbi:uncharacterized protein LOC122523791 [Polistes fuscatus]|uniref:uncharacterized protein LOC122514077 n=1 Tax=Polistes fuscatus TaxID=30207 RepID=UPI001CA94802|nr:uncharacterized protein LOC122514077 [Polistes fuscatus]XP_043501603.1 uncharacterized protein LOC122523791 [Polistes fuscatus]
MAEQLRDLHIKGGQIKAYMTRAKSHIDKLAQTRSTPRLRFRHDEILVKLREFEEVQTKIELIDDTSDHSVERESFEDALFTIIGNIDELLEDWSNSAHSASTNAPSPTQSQLSAGSNGHIRLPKIELPQFGGSYEEWYSFRDTFKSLIHENSSLSSIQKFHYLRSSLKGEAADITRALTISDVNYEEAWKLLQNRYDNKRRIVHSHIRGIMDISKIQKENSVALRQLVDAASRNTRALSAL